MLLRARRRDFDLYTCPFVLAELREVLAHKFRATAQEVKKTIALITEASTPVTLADEALPAEPISRDPDDDPILACARGGGADYLVSGDRDLLEIGSWEGITILTPRDFEQMFS